MKIYPPWVTNNVKHVRCNLNYERNIHKTSGKIIVLVQLIHSFPASFFFVNCRNYTHQLAKSQVKVHMLPKPKTRTLVLLCTQIAIHTIRLKHQNILIFQSSLSIAVVSNTKMEWKKKHKNQNFYYCNMNETIPFSRDTQVNKQSSLYRSSYA